MTVADLVELLVEDCDPDSRVYVDYGGCVYEVIDVRTYDGEVILDAI